jgi:hypothetical protein
MPLDGHLAMVLFLGLPFLLLDAVGLYQDCTQGHIFSMANVLILSLTRIKSFSLSLSLSFWHAAQLLAIDDCTNDMVKLPSMLLAKSMCRGCNPENMTLFGQSLPITMMSCNNCQSWKNPIAKLEAHASILPYGHMSTL